MARSAMRRRLGGALAITVVATLAGLLSPMGVSATAATREPPQSYVALGDSYTAARSSRSSRSIPWAACGRTTTIPISSRSRSESTTSAIRAAAVPRPRT